MICFSNLPQKTSTLPITGKRTYNKRPEGRTNGRRTDGRTDGGQTNERMEADGGTGGRTDDRATERRTNGGQTDRRGGAWTNRRLQLHARMK